MVFVTLKKFLLYINCSNYLDKWFAPFDTIGHFEWILLLENCLVWENVQNSLSVSELNEIFSNISQNDLFDEVFLINKYVIEKKEEWREQNFQIDLKWVQIFSHFKENDIPLQNITRIVEYCLCLPGKNAPTERVFSSVNKLWTSEKNQMTVETAKAILLVKFNSQQTCEQFKENLEKNETLLHSSQKYA